MAATTRSTLRTPTPRNFAGCWTDTSRRAARWAASADAGRGRVLLQMWTPRPCARGLLPRGTRSATADVSLLQWWRHTGLLGTSGASLVPVPGVRLLHRPAHCVLDGLT